MHELKSPAAIPICRYVLLDQDLSSGIKTRGAVLSEAVATICSLFPDPEAVDVYVRFVLEKEVVYSSIRDINQHWGKVARENNLTVDILCGIGPLVKSGDPRARIVLIKMLKLMTSSDMGDGVMWLLEPDGYTVTLTPLDREGIRRRLVPGSAGLM